MSDPAPELDPSLSETSAAPEPRPDQKRTTLNAEVSAQPSLPSAQADSSPSRHAATGPGDSAPLPKVHEDLLNDGIADLQSKRQHRPVIVSAALVALAVFVINLTAVVAVISCVFLNAMKPEAIAKAVAADLSSVVRDAASSEASSTVAPVKVATSGTANTTTRGAAAASAVATDSSRVVKVKAEIIGEIKESLIPLVALVSILTIAAVVILGTLLKAAFAPHPNHRLGKAGDVDDPSPVPLIDAIKALVEALKGVFSKG